MADNTNLEYGIKYPLVHIQSIYAFRQARRSKVGTSEAEEKYEARWQGGWVAVNFWDPGPPNRSVIVLTVLIWLICYTSCVGMLQQALSPMPLGTFHNIVGRKWLHQRPFWEAPKIGFAQTKTLWNVDRRL